MDVHIATVYDRGRNDGDIILGVFATLKDAMAAVESYDPYDGDEDKDEGGEVKWEITDTFDNNPPHSSGATCVINYMLKNSNWWRAHCITYEVY